MINFKRIALVIFLFGSVTVFSYWSTKQFDRAFEDLNNAYLASVSLSYTPRQKLELASTSPEMMGEHATSTDNILEIDSATTTTATTTNNIDFSFTFPQAGNKVFVGCTYPISWQSPVGIKSLGISLVDASVKEEVGPIASGLARENIIGNETQKLEWKVGGVWSGEYYMKVLNINGAETEIRSNVFGINKMSENISTIEKEIICKSSGGLI